MLFRSEITENTTPSSSPNDTSPPINTPTSNVETPNSPPDIKQAQQETGQNTSTTKTTTTSPDYQEFVKQVKIIANGPQPTNAEKLVAHI